MKISNELVIHEIESCDSTQDVLKKYTANNPNQSILIIANEQTMGKGQRNKIWHSPLDKGWYFSFYIPKLSIPVDQVQCIGWLIAIYLVEAFKTLEINTWAKWPNDIYTSKGKLAGILIENQMGHKEVKSVSAGIGINVENINVGDQPFMGVTSLINEFANNAVSVPPKLDFILPLIQNFKTHINQPFLNLEELHQKLLKYSFGINRYFTFEQDGIEFKAKVNTIDSNGTLILETKDGLHKAHSGSIKWINYA